MAQKEGFVSPRSTLVGQPGSEAPPGPHSLPGQFKSLFDTKNLKRKDTLNLFKVSLMAQKEGFVSPRSTLVG
ncbi:MAG: hypothetical protein IKJ11_09385, partial [Clostridia bacterium]|nr:hypothetical protein [Clostridia bacterium]